MPATSPTVKEPLYDSVRMMDLKFEDRLSTKPNIPFVVNKMIEEEYRVCIHTKRDVMTLYKAFERLRRKGKALGMWTRKVGPNEWVAQARKEGEEKNPLGHIERSYNTSYNYGLWKGLAQKLKVESQVYVGDENAAKRVVAAFRHYFGREDESIPALEYAPAEGDQFLIWIPGRTNNPGFGTGSGQGIPTS